MPDKIEFRTKPQIALDQVEHALSNGIRVFAWTFDELYGRDGGFLNRLETLEQLFVGEVPKDFRGWLKEPPVIQKARKRPGKSSCGRRGELSSVVMQDLILSGLIPILSRRCLRVFV